jgi:hypothetical protein
MKLTGPGCPLPEKERIAGRVFFRVVLHGALMGYTIPRPDEPDAEPDDLPGSFVLSLQGAVPVNGCGIFPAGAGTAAGFARIPYMR